MKKKILFLLMVCFSNTIFCNAQTDSDILFTVGQMPVTVGEFKYEYSKSKGKSTLPISEFVDSYADYKRRVAEAIALNIDTISSLKREYKAMMSQVEEPYLKDSIIELKYADIVYNRLKKNYLVKEILVEFPPKENLLPKDTAEAYVAAKQIIFDIKSQNAGYEGIFGALSSKTYLNQGISTKNYTWITSLMSDPFLENTIYELKKGEVTMDPIRSNYGYHILKIEDERPDIGLAQISHILLEYPKNAKQTERDSLFLLANKIYNRLESGSSFENLYKEYSSDTLTNLTGSLGSFGVQRPMNDFFLNAISKVPIGGYTKPLLRDDGVHIVRVDDRISEYPWNSSIKKNIISQIQSENSLFKDFIIADQIIDLSQSIPFKMDNTNLSRLESITDKDPLFSDKFNSSIESYLNNNLFKIGNKSYTIYDFLFYTKENTEVLKRYRLSSDQLKYALNAFIYKMLLETKKQSLLKNNSPLADASRDYYEGLLYFYLNSNLVWDVDNYDNKVLEKIFNENKKDYNWEIPRFEGLLIFTKNKGLKKKIQSYIAFNRDSNTLATDLLAKFNKEGEQNVIIERGFWSKGENNFIDNLIYDVPSKKSLDGFPEYFVEGIKIERPRSLNDVRGKVSSDYQKILDQNLTERLRTKYPINVNSKILNQLMDEK